MKTIIGVLALVCVGLFLFNALFGPTQKQKQHSSDSEDTDDADKS